MISTLLLLLSQSLFLSLHLTGNPGSFPQPLSREEEQACLERWAEGDLEARNCLVEHNLRLVAHIIKKYYTQNDNQEDLISIGTIGLIKAVNTYHPGKKTRLATYAARCIENAILTSRPWGAESGKGCLFWPANVRWLSDSGVAAACLR